MAKLKKVKVVRTKQREGLIRARLLGFSAAHGDVVTFLDSHCECTIGKLSMGQESHNKCIYSFVCVCVCACVISLDLLYTSTNN